MACVASVQPARCARRIRSASRPPARPGRPHVDGSSAYGSRSQARARREGAVGEELRPADPEPPAGSVRDHRRDLRRRRGIVGRAGQPEEPRQEGDAGHERAVGHGRGVGGELDAQIRHGPEVGLGHRRHAVAEEPPGDESEARHRVSSREDRQSRGEASPRVGAVDDAGRLACRVALDLGAPGAVRGRGVDAGQGEGQAVRGDGVPRDVGKQDRAIRHGAIQVVPRRLPGLPPARLVVLRDEPGIRLQAFGEAGQATHRGPQVGRPGERRAGRDDTFPEGMRVRVHEPRQDRPPAEVHDGRIRAGQGEDLRVAADGQDPVVREADGGRPAACRIGHVRATERARRRVRRQRAVEGQDRPAVEDRVVVRHCPRV